MNAPAAVKEIVAWACTDDPPAKLADTLDNLYQPQITSMEEVARLGNWAIVRDAKDVVLELATGRNAWWQTGNETPVLLESIAFPATVMFRGEPR